MSSQLVDLIICIMFVILPLKLTGLAYVMLIGFNFVFGIVVAFTVVVFLKNKFNKNTFRSSF